MKSISISYTKVILILCFVTSIGEAQNWQWAKRAGSTNDNTGPGTDELITDLKIDDAGNIYATGYFYANPSFNNGETFGPTTPVGFGSSDAYLIKYSACGKTLWTRRMGGNSYDGATSLVIDDNGGVIVTGYCTGTGTNEFGDGTHDTLANASSGVQFIAKFDTAGNFKEVKNYPWGLGKIFINSQGDYIVTDGLSAVKINTTNGVPTATYNFVTPTPFYPAVNGISMDKNDNIYICGAFNNTINIGPGTLLLPTASTLIANFNCNNSLIMKFSPTGNMLWYKRGTGNSGGDLLFGCTPDTSGTKVAAGGIAWNTTQVFGYNVDGGTGTLGNAFYLLDAATGNLISAKTGSASFQGNIAPYLTDRDNNFICKGWINGFLAFNTTSYTAAGISGNQQNCIGKFDAAGNFIYISLLPQQATSNGTDRTSAVAMSEQGNIYIGGKFGGTLDSLGTAVNIIGGTEDGYVAKYGFACNSSATSLTPLPPTSLTAVYQASLTNKVTWIDNSHFETGFELWAIGGSITSYSLIATLAANTTTYNHSGLQSATNYCYKVRAINGTGPSVYTNIGCALTPANTVGIVSISENKDFTIFPNPTTGNITLQFATPETKVEIEVINSLGEQLEKRQISAVNGENKYQMGLPGIKGIYMVQIHLEGRTITKKVVVN